MRENYFWPLYGRKSSAKSCGKVRFTAHPGLRAHTRFVGPQIASCIFYNTQTRTQRTGRGRVRLGRPRPRFRELGWALLTAHRLEMNETSGFQQLSLGRPANFTCPTLEMVLIRPRLFPSCHLVLGLTTYRAAAYGSHVVL